MGERDERRPIRGGLAAGWGGISAEPDRPADATLSGAMALSGRQSTKLGPSLAAHLRAFPGGTAERNRAPSRDVEL